MRFLVFSDLHLDNEAGATEPDRAGQRRAERRACLDRLLALADAHAVDAILSAGDLYEHAHLRPGTAGHLVDRLGRAGRPVFLAPGDRDPHTPDSLYATADWPANVHVFSEDLLVPVELADGFRLWGAAHLRHDDTPGFLDGFRIVDDAVNLALFHGSEVGATPRDPAPVVAPFRAAQVEHAGLTHAFVGHARVGVDASWHTCPGALDAAESGAGGAVVVDVAPDGTVQRRRVEVSVSPVHEVTIDLTGADSTDEVLERMLALVEDLQGTVQVSLHGRPASHVVVDDDELTSWSTERLVIVVGPRPSEPAPAPVERPAIAAPAPVERPAIAAPPPPVEPPAPVAPTPVERPATASAPPAEARPDLGGLDLATLEAHLQALRARPVTAPAPAAVSTLAAPPGRGRSRARAVGRAVAAVVTVAAATGLLLLGQSVVERVVPVAAIVLVAVVLVVTRRGAVEDPEPPDVRARVRAALVLAMEHDGELAAARQAATTALRQAGLPTDPDELAALVDAARDERAGQAPGHRVERSPDARATRRPTAPRTAASDPTSVTPSSARVTAV